MKIQKTAWLVLLAAVALCGCRQEQMVSKSESASVSQHVKPTGYTSFQWPATAIEADKGKGDLAWVKFTWLEQTQPIGQQGIWETNHCSADLGHVLDLYREHGWEYAGVMGETVILVSYGENKACDFYLGPVPHNR